MINAFRKKYLLNLIIGLVNLGLIVFIVFFPAKAILGDIAKLSSLKKTLFSLKEQEDNFDKLNKSYQANLEIIDKIDSSFVNSEEPVDFLSFIENSSAELGLTTKIVPASPQKFKNDAWLSMTFRLSSKGGPEKIMAFLDKLENSKFLAEVTDISFKKLADKDKSLNQIEVEFNLKAFTE